NKTWEGSGDKLIEFWEYLSTQSWVDSIPHFTNYWDSWRRLDRRIASGESARRYFSTKEFIFKGVPNVFVPKTPLLDKLVYLRQQTIKRKLGEVCKVPYLYKLRKR
ncbi:MAG TPA: hypothetical protein VEL11_02070, partial [Candidatus Bathyarchaeia archaeon]|nr:hypothetical protein [Candidatus Bathyarchaeia archaeon]